MHKIGEVKTYKCDICVYTTIHAQSFKDHMINHKRIKPYKCPTCEKTFALERTMLQHNIRVHNGAQYKCELCEQPFKDPGALRLHQKRVRHNCHICNMNFCTAEFSLNCNSINGHEMQEIRRENAPVYTQCLVLNACQSLRVYIL